MPTLTDATELEGLEITGAAGVRRGANRAQFGADGWALMKADGTPIEGDAMASANATKTRTAKDGEGDTSTASESTSETTTTETATTEAAAGDGAQATETQDVEKALEQMPESVRKAFEDQRAALAKAQADATEASKVAKAERDARLDREYVGKAETFKLLPGKPATFGPVLRAVSEQCDPLVALELDRVLRAYDEQLRFAGLTKAVGSDGDGDTSAWAQLEGKAAELRKADTSLTREQAITKASELHPDLVEAHRNEQKGR